MDLKDRKRGCQGRMGRWYVRGVVRGQWIGSMMAMFDGKLVGCRSVQEGWEGKE